MRTAVTMPGEPVFDNQGQFAVGLSISVRAERMTMTEFIDTLLPVLMKARDTLRLFGE